MPNQPGAWPPSAAASSSIQPGPSLAPPPPSASQLSTNGSDVKRSKLVSTAGYWISAAILVLGCGAAAVWFGIAVVKLASAPAGYSRTAIPGQMTVTLEPGTYTVFYEYRTLAPNSYMYNAPTVRVYNDGETVPLTKAFLTSSYTWNEYRGESIAEFEVYSSGEFRVDVSGEPQPDGFSVAVGRDGVSSAVGGILGSMFLGGGSFVVALAVFIVTIVRRGRVKRESRSTLPPYGQPGYFPIPTGPYVPGGYPGAGWGPPQYPPPQGPPTQYPSPQGAPPQAPPPQYPMGQAPGIPPAAGVWPPVGQPIWSAQSQTPDASQTPMNPFAAPDQQPTAGPAQPPDLPAPDRPDQPSSRDPEIT